MKLVKTLTVSALAVASVVLSAGIASAQTPTTTTTRGMNSDYIGVGVSGGVTNGGRQNDAAVFGGNVQGRYAIKNAPVSIRGAALFGGDSVAIVPTLTYDAPIAKNTNLYVGGGYSFVTEDGQASQLGNKNAPVVTIGAESQVAKNTVIYTDAKLGINAYQGSDSDALSLQAGVGYSF